YSIMDGNDQGMFTIDSSTGSITTTGRKFDRESESRYRLTVLAQDAANRCHKGRTVVVIDVKDENDNAPEFPLNSYVFNIRENTPAAQVAIVTATDRDSGTNAAITYSLFSGENKFMMNSKTGEIRTVTPLDHETKDSYTMRISAFDGKHTTFVPLITVDDVNDNAPFFALSVYKTGVYEDVAVGSIVRQLTAVDLDVGINARLSYSLVSGDTSYFTVDSQGVIRTKGAFDRETKASYQVALRAQDGGSPSRSGQATVEIEILDVNDNRPVFSSAQYTASVDEDVAIGAAMVTVTASDKDNGNNADLRYSFTSGNTNHAFTLDAVTGVVTVSRSLDFEQRSSYALGLSVTDRGSPPLTDTSHLLINVNDINDNPPVFSPSAYQSRVKENTPAGTQVSATDRDSSTNGALVFGIIKGNDDGVFTIDGSTGIISIAKSPDYENKTRYDLTVQARDRGVPVKYDTAQVTIFIEDVNDHSPVFSPSNYSKQIPESTVIGSTVVTVTATDLDSGPRGRLEYRLISGNVKGAFNIDANSGSIRVSSELDRETTPSYSLQVEARDGGSTSRSSSTRVTIALQDINDNSPIFQGPYVFRVSESSSPGHQIGQVAATDADDSSNGDVRYALSDNTDVFSINTSTGLITLKTQLDYEKKTQYMVTVTAKDGGTPSRSSLTVVKVMVDDVNDNPPQFAKSLYTCTVGENLAAGVAVCYVTATDADSGANGKISYSILSGNENMAFAMDRFTGEITTRVPLDRETIASYSLTINADDGSLVRFMAATTVNISIADENDNQPTFTGPSRFNISEDSPTGTRVGQLTATDRDIGPNGAVTYAIISGNQGNSFQLDPRSGILSVRSTLDRETIPSYTLVVKASDAGSPQQSITASIHVSVLDVNDNAPRFEKSLFSGEIREDASVHSTVLQVKVEDKDEGSNGAITLSLSGEGSDNFTIDSTGFVLSKTPLDYETTAAYQLTVTARDGGSPSKSATAQVKITIINVNDNVPSFVSPAQVTSIPEDVAINTHVVKLNATDSDGTPLTFDIVEGNAGSSFKIDQSSGLISVAKRLDRETTANYTLVVRATETGSQGESVYNNATIRVLDVNDNAPVFNPGSYAKSLHENLPIGQTVAKVTATDRDEGENAKVTYELSVGDTSKFEVNPATGLVTTKRPLDREDQASYSLRVTAMDHGKPSQSAVAAITLTINDLNDNSPQFSQSKYTLTVTENTANGSNILRVLASDPDAGANGRVTYSIISGNHGNAFRIDSTTGRITVVGVVDREALASYNLTISAKDSGVPPWVSTAFVAITVADENDNSPIFASNETSYGIDEGVSIGSRVAVVTATDRDEGSNAQVFYSIVRGDTSAFAINAMNGVLTVKKEINRETVPTYTLTIRASDRGSPMMTSDKELTVVVNDVNDNPPVFNSQSYIGSVRENSAQSTSVLTVAADDSDVGANAVLRYSIISGNDEKRFKINSTSGVIMTTTPLDFEEKSQYGLEVTATDSKYTAKTNVTIRVINLNDITPAFTQQNYTASVRENSPTSTSVVKVSASDRDSFGSLSYSIVGGKDSDKFSIDQRSGIISTADVLDRELVSLYAIQVRVTDAGNPPLSNLTWVTIKILDENDNSPKFDSSSYSSSILENSAPSSFSFKLAATDADEGTNARITYNLSRNDAFMIGASSGVITLAQPLDRENKSTYDLAIQARDHGTPPQASSITIRVTVIDINDHRPLINSSSLRGSVRENQPKETHVMRILASDADTGLNAELTFSLLSNEHKSVFTLDNTTGDISTKVPLDREQQAVYTLRIGVADKGNPSLSSVADVIIDVIDEDDNCPRFQPTEYNVTISESLPRGASIVQVTARDID
ncbi:predicted protein, partial [Nematostella vectensis]